MTIDERKKDRELRERARELNRKEGERVYVSRKLDFHLKRFLAHKVRNMAQSNHMKKLYEFIKKVKSTSHVSHILVDSDGRKYSTDASKAEAIADYFASVFGKASSGIQSLPSVSNECFEMPIVSPQTYKYLTDPAENNGEDSERKAFALVSKLQLIPTEQHGFLPGASTRVRNS
ncbi:hypothetical protein COOONC_01217 [Cooperia oncophora]